MGDGDVDFGGDESGGTVARCGTYVRGGVLRRKKSWFDEPSRMCSDYYTYCWTWYRMFLYVIVSKLSVHSYIESKAFALDPLVFPYLLCSC